MSDPQGEDLFEALMDLGDHEAEKPQVIKGIIPLCGSKARIARDITDLFPSCQVFVDVFGGSGVISVNYNRGKLHVYNDAYSAVVDFYRILIDRKEELKQLLHSMPTQSREYWEVCRREYITETDPLLRAAKWYYWLANSVMIRGGAFARRTNSHWQNPMSSLSAFDSIHARMKNVQMENQDFRRCFADYDGRHTVFYCDPPYFGTTQVYNRNWTERDLRDLLKLIDNCKGEVYLSHSPLDLIDDYRKWDGKKTWTLSEHCNVESTERSGRWTECLWIKES